MDALEKLHTHEKKVFPALDAMERSGEMPELMKKRYDAVKNGDESADAYAALSDSLFEYSGMFDEKEQSHIAEYRELIEAYFKEAGGTDTPNTYDPL